VLYELAKERGNPQAALDYHEKYVAADLGYSDDESARRLAYVKVTHESIANRQQIATLTKQNQVLQLQKELAAETVENSRLYIALLISVLIFVGIWAYSTKRSQLHFMSASQRDGLTGICNRHHFISQAEEALEAGSRSQQQLCVILCDLDYFKSINDRHGHAMGDFVLRDTVARCQAHLRENETFGRYGGEEFSILLPDCGPEMALERAEKLRAAVAEISAGYGAFEPTVSASFGVAATGISGYELRRLLAHADAALYRAKLAGRNRVVLYEPPTDLERASVTVLDERPDFIPRSSASA